MPTWKEINGYEGYYEASSDGIIRSMSRIINHPLNGEMKRKGVVLKPCLNHKGYKVVVLCKKGKNHTLILHILIAKTFIANPENKPQVNHINGIKTDNRIENLEWCTNRENFDHAIKNGLLDNTFKRIQENRRKVKISKEDIECIQFESIKDAARFIGTTRGAVGMVLNGSRRAIRGYKAEYI